MCSYDMYTFYTYVFSIMVSLTSSACTLLTTNKAVANKESKSFMICSVCVCVDVKERCLFCSEISMNNLFAWFDLYIKIFMRRD